MLATKHHPPAPRGGLIERSAALEKLKTFDESVVSVVAPAGYGKTTLLGHFHEQHTGPTAWLTLDESDSDPVVLLNALTDGLTESGMVADRDGIAYQSESVLTRGMHALEERIEPTTHGVLFLDQVNHVQSQSSLDVIGAVMTRLGGPLRVVTASRTGSGLPLGLLRAQGRLAELDRDDLAMDEREAAQIFAALGVDSGDRMDWILQATEGWPAGVYLAALAIKTGAVDSGDLDIRGDHVYFAEYLRDELIAEAPANVRRFLMKSSLLPRLSGPLCDFALQMSGSHQMLSDMEQSNLLVVPLDHTRTWYRYHSLMEGFLRSEMSRRHPDEVVSIHSRAAEWFESNGFAELALDQAKKAKDVGQVAQLFARHARRIASQGRLGTLGDWVDWLEDADALGNYGELAATAAYFRSMEGNPGGAENMSRYAFHTSEGTLRDDASLGRIALTVRSMQMQRGPERALSDARRAVETVPAESEWLHLSGAAEALAVLAKDGLESSQQVWMRVYDWAQTIGALPAVSLALAERALIEIARGDWTTATELSDQAVDDTERIDISGYLSSALVFTVAARCAAHDGRLEEARAHLSAASRLRPRLSSAFPAVSVQTLHEMARGYVELADIAGARSVIRHAADIMVMRPKLGTLVTEHETLREQLASMPKGAVGASSLTTAELRLLPMLITHLTYPEIAERLFISRHTVKTQAMSIYRKLGVSSRTEAVDRARELGLLSL